MYVTVCMYYSDGLQVRILLGTVLIDALIALAFADSFLFSPLLRPLRIYNVLSNSLLQCHRHLNIFLFEYGSRAFKFGKIFMHFGTATARLLFI